MARQRYEDRLQPALLDRLRLRGPEFVDMATLRNSVRDNLRRILEAVSAAGDPLDPRSPSQDDPDKIQIHEDPVLSTSVLNFGFVDFGIHSPSEIASSPHFDIAQAVTQAIRAFEPRIRRENLHVRLIEDADEDPAVNIPATLVLEIRGEIWGDPVESILLRSEIGLIDGRAIVEERVEENS